MTTALTELLVVVLVVMIAVAGLLVVHRLVPLSIRESNTAAIGVIYAALYVVFGNDGRFLGLPRVEQVQHVPEHGKK